MQHDQIHEDRWELIQFAKSQTKAKRPQEIPPPWDEGLVIKYRWDEAVPEKRPEFVDAAGMPLAQEVLESLKAMFPRTTVFPDTNMFFGGVHLAGRAESTYDGMGDPRRGGAVAVAGTES